MSLVGADAQHGRDAVAAERSAQCLTVTQVAQAGYAAASIRFWRLNDAFGAENVLAVTKAAQTGSPVEERAMALNNRILLSEGRVETARGLGSDCLLRYPQGGAQDWVNELVATSPSGHRQQ